ncbi:MAG: SLBB domain-containing protein, partial [Bacteroidetes bacterium]|nr:SLBB domain-containing protein [Bacteroidota bacterium]
VNVIQKTDKEFKVRDISKSDFKSYIPQSGDVFSVSKILDRYENRVTLEGAVFRPNTYSFTEGMRISDLISQGDGLKEDAYTQRVRIVRLQKDLNTEIINVNLELALSGDLNYDILLKREDVVTVYSVLDFKEKFKVSIDGEVKSAGEYSYFEGLTLNDIIIQSGGLTGSASKRVEIARMIKSDAIDNESKAKVKLFNIEITPENNEQLTDFILEPFDAINIRRLAIYEKPQSVTVSGEVNYTGKYVLATKKENVYDVIMRAGGLKVTGDINGVKIKRPLQQDQIDMIAAVAVNDTIQSKVVEKLENDVKFSIIPINWKKVIKDRESSSNVRLFAGDEIVVANFNEGVKVSGNVLLNSEIPYVKSKGFNYYLDAVGGVDSKGWKKRAYVIYPNGRGAVSKSFLFVRSSPKVLPGSQIIVPEKPAVQKLTTGEFVSLAGILTSLAGVIIAILR